MMKKIFSLVALLAVMVAPVTLSSCDDDDVKTVLNIVEQLGLFQSSDELTGTEWLTADSLHYIGFSSGSQGAMADGDTGQVVERQFSYTMQNDENGGTTFTFNFTDGTSTSYAVMAYTAQSNLSLRNNTTGVTLNYIYVKQ